MYVSVCLSVTALAATVSLAKTAEPIETSCGFKESSIYRFVRRRRRWRRCGQSPPLLWKLVTSHPLANSWRTHNLIWLVSCYLGDGSAFFGSNYSSASAAILFLGTTSFRAIMSRMMRACPNDSHPTSDLSRWRLVPQQRRQRWLR